MLVSILVIFYSIAAVIIITCTIEIYVCQCKRLFMKCNLSSFLTYLPSQTISISRRPQRRLEIHFAQSCDLHPPALKELSSVFSITPVSDLDIVFCHSLSPKEITFTYLHPHPSRDSFHHPLLPCNLVLAYRSTIVPQRLFSCLTHTPRDYFHYLRHPPRDFYLLTTHHLPT